MKIEVYTDGSATVKTKPGGYGWVMVIDGVKHSEGKGHIELASNNDAEMEAAIYGLAAALKFVTQPSGHYLPFEGQPSEVTLVSDSQIVLNWANGTYRFKQEAKYKRFEVLKALMGRLNAKTRWVRGHSGDEHNERCDELANEGRTGPKPIKPPKKPNVRNRLFRWDEAKEHYTPVWDSVKDMEENKTVVVSDKDVVKNHAGYSMLFTLEAMTRIVVELIEKEEARKK